ncbi:MAG: polymorphic toxin type 8 domain-containing protein, partial [bacterium]
WNRWYDPQLGKWLSEDPIGFAGGDVNLGRYVGNHATGAVDANGLFMDDPALGRRVPPLIEARFRNKNPKPFDATNSTRVIEWWVGTYRHEVRKVGQAYEYQVYDQSWIWMLGVIPWGRNNELIRQNRVVLTGVMPEEVELELWRQTFQGNLATGARTVEDSGAQVAVALIFVADVGIPGPEDVIVAAARKGGLELFKEGAEWVLTRSGRKLHGPELDEAAAKIVEEVTKRKTGRSGGQERLRELAEDENLSSAERGWIKQEINSIDRGQRTQIRRPPGKDLAHERGREAAKGYGYEHSNLQNKDLHKLQHKYDDFGRKNKERPVPEGENP